MRSLIKSKFFIKNKIVALNFKEFYRAMQGIELCDYYAISAGKYRIEI